MGGGGGGLGWWRWRGRGGRVRLGAGTGGAANGRVAAPCPLHASPPPPPACLSSAGFQAGSNRMRRLAPTRLRPQPPALDDSRNTNWRRAGSQNCLTKVVRLPTDVDPSRRRQGQPRSLHSTANKSSVWVALDTMTTRSGDVGLAAISASSRAVAKENLPPIASQPGGIVAPPPRRPRMPARPPPGREEGIAPRKPVGQAAGWACRPRRRPRGVVDELGMVAQLAEGGDGGQHASSRTWRTRRKHLGRRQRRCKVAVQRLLQG